jgi:hypothetical protein
MEILSSSLDNKTPNEEKPTPISELLMQKRAQLLAELHKHELAMAALQEEYSARVARLKEEQRPLREGLLHIEALLRLEGWKDTGPGSKTASSSAPDMMSYIDAAYRLLEKKRQPMHYKSICAALQAQEVHISGNDPAATLLAKMSRDGRFKRIRKRGTYALAPWKVAAAKPRRSRRKRRQ